MPPAKVTSYAQGLRHLEKTRVRFLPHAGWHAASHLAAPACLGDPTTLLGLSQLYLSLWVGQPDLPRPHPTGFEWREIRKRYAWGLDLRGHTSRESHVDEGGRVLPVFRLLPLLLLMVSLKLFPHVVELALLSFPYFEVFLLSVLLLLDRLFFCGHGCTRSSPHSVPCWNV